MYISTSPWATAPGHHISLFNLCTSAWIHMTHWLLKSTRQCPGHSFLRLNLAAHSDVLWWYDAWNDLSMMQSSQCQNRDVIFTLDASGSWDMGLTIILFGYSTHGQHWLLTTTLHDHKEKKEEVKTFWGYVLQVVKHGRVILLHFLNTRGLCATLCYYTVITKKLMMA